MQLYVCILLATLITAWDPVRPGVLVKKIGDMFIINQSVRIILCLDNVTYIRDSLNMINNGLEKVENTLEENHINNVRMFKKIEMIKEKVEMLENNFLHKSKREKRAVAMIAAIGALAGLGVANLGLHADLRHSVNTIEHSLGKLDVLQDATDDIQDSLNDVTDIVEQISKDTLNVRESLNIFMLLDQLHIKTNELSHNIEQLIQDLVLANTGSVTSSLLPIRNLIQVITTAKTEWNFAPFFENSNVALYYPLLNSYLNGSSVIIDIPFSSELRYYIYKFLPFPMKFNGSVVAVDTDIVDPINYVLSVDSLKESQITNDDLQMCKRTNLDLYLCPSKYFTLQEALGSSCAASLVKNITILETCQFKVLDNLPKHETVQDSHYIYFPQQTTVSVICQNFRAKVASVIGLYKVPDQCELHSDLLTTIANKKQTVQLTKDMLLKDIDITMPKSSPHLKINRLAKKRTNVHVSDSGITGKTYALIILPSLVTTGIGVSIVFYMYRKLNNSRTLKHISATP